MLKQIRLVAAFFLAAFASFSLYAVNVNTADEAALRLAL